MEFSTSAPNFGVLLFEKDISDFMRQVGDELEFKQEHQTGSAVSDEDSATALSDIQAGQRQQRSADSRQWRYKPWQVE